MLVSFLDNLALLFHSVSLKLRAADYPHPPRSPPFFVACWLHLCSTMDIHAGGFDLKFPHHDNEIAQVKKDMMYLPGDMLFSSEVYQCFV